jgi:hypothetical protein
VSEASAMDLDDRIAFAGLFVPDSDTVDSRVRHWVSFLRCCRRVGPQPQCKGTELGSQAVLEASVDPPPISRAGQGGSGTNSLTLMLVALTNNRMGVDWGIVEPRVADAAAPHRTAAIRSPAGHHG